MNTVTELRQHYASVQRRLNPRPVPILAIVRPVKPEARVVYQVPVGPAVTCYPPMNGDYDVTAILSGFRVSKSKQILLDVCAEFAVTLVDLKSPCREVRITRARHEAVYRLRENTTLSFPQIAKILSRDHSSCVHAYHKLRAEKAGLKKQ